MRQIAVLLAVGFASTSAFGLKPEEIYKRSAPAVVLFLGSDDGKTGSGGTGSIISPDGRIVTNAHVVINEAGQPFKTLYVFLKPPTLSGDNKRDLVNRYTAKVVSYSPAEELDLAIVQLDNPPPNLPTIAFSNPDDVEVGDEVIAIGHPEQGGLWTLTTGTVSTLIANFNKVKGKDVFQTEASVNRGNSGGPLLDERGNMIGINTMIARQGAGGVAITGVNFALKSSVAVRWLAGQGMGLAYAPPAAQGQAEPPMVVAVAPEASKPAAPETPTGPIAASEPPKPSAAVAPTPVEEQPAATIVIAEAPPKEPAKLRDEGKGLGSEKGSEKVQAGKPLDVAKAKPKFVTEQRPFSLDDLRRQQMQELEGMMEEMGGKSRKGGKKGGGLW